MKWSERPIRCLAVIVAAMMVAAASGLSTLAAAPPLPTEYVTVFPGDMAPIVQRSRKIDFGDTPAKKGRPTITQSTDTGATIWQLFYAANEVTEQTTDTLTFKEDGEATERTLQITIKPRPVGFNSDPSTYQAGFKALFILFVLAVLLESGLAIVFNWRPFVESLNARAVRPPISFAAALTFVSLYGLDTVTTLVNAFSAKPVASGAAGSILTALIIAGGSAGVNSLLVAFGYRQQRTPETAAPKPPPNKAWFSIKLVRDKAVGPVTVLLGPPPATGAAVAQPPVVGIVRGHTPFAAYFRADPTRFPSYGGHAVTRDTIVVAKLIGFDENGKQIESATWGPYQVAEGAFVDVSLVL